MTSGSTTAPRWTRREFVRGLGLGTLGAAMAGCAPAARAGPTPGRKPNIIFVLADDLGYGDLGCFGQTKIRTPRLDALAAEGMRFTQAYAGSTVCAPSRCCLMTGLHTGHAHVRGNALIPLRPEDPCVAEAMKKAGYVTGIIGKWGLGEPDTTGLPTRKGFDYWFGFLNQKHAHNYYPDHVWRNEERVPLPNVVVDPGVATKRVVYIHDEFAKESLAFVEKHKDRPFFLYLAYTIPHANNEGGKEGMEIPSDAPYSGEDWPQQEKNFAAMVTRLDRDVGALVDLLKRLRIDKDTLVLFTSDNGPHKEGGHDATFFKSSGPLRGTKRDLYEGGVRVPTIAWWPGRVPAGSISDHAWAFWDFPITAAELAGADWPAGCDGLSFVPALCGQPQKPHEYLYWEFFEGGFSQAVRMGDWKGVRKGLQGKTELFNLRDDLGETQSVADAHPDVVRRIEEIFRTARVDSPHFSTTAVPARPKPKPKP